MTLHSPLEACHQTLGATMVEFAGWMMPVRYSSDLGEHISVRTGVGLFDLSHMGEIVVTGRAASTALDFALVSWISRIEIGRAKYTMICTEDGGVIDDLIVYRQALDRYMIVANAGNHAVVFGEVQARCRNFDCEVLDESERTALIGVQGPLARETVSTLMPHEAKNLNGLPYYASTRVTFNGHHMVAARTGYTGEDGFEFFCPTEMAIELWERILEKGASRIVPCGLAARDTLRLEAGMPLYGHELGLDRTPFEAGLGRVVHFGDEENQREDFIGKAALIVAEERVRRWVDKPENAPDDARMLVGLTGQGRRAARAGYIVYDGHDEVGYVTSGAPSPTLDHPIAMAYVHPRYRGTGTRLDVDVRGRREEMMVTALPFYKR